MTSHLRVKSPWAQLGIFFGLLGGALLVTALISAFILVAKGANITDLKKMDFSDPKTIGILKWIQAVSTITIFLLPALILAYIVFNDNQLYFFGFHKPEKNNYYIIAIALMILSFPFVGWLGELNQHIPLTKSMTDMEKEAGRQMEAFLKVRSKADVIINLLIMALLPAICEEACFRGCLQRILIQIFKSPWAGIIAAAIFFSAFHMQFAGFLPRMFLGVLLGALFWYSGSLWPNIIAHFFYNGIQVIAVTSYPKLIDQNPAIPIYAAAVSGLIVFGLLYVMKRQSKASFAAVYEFEAVNEHNEFLS